MTNTIELPLLIEPDQLEPWLGHHDLRIIDLCRPDTYSRWHVPDAIHVDYSEIVRNEKPVGGLVPHADAFNALVQKLGISADTHVVTYDDEGGGNASRLIFTLHAYGHNKTSLLNGGIYSWLKESHPVSSKTSHAEPGNHRLELAGSNVIEAEEILSRLGEKDFALLDARSPEEFAGEKVFSQRGGHIPGARLFEWTDAMDRERNLRLKSDEELMSMLKERGFRKDQEIVVYCQTHHRSALSYLMLKHLGFEKVRGYHGAWSDWGNRADTPLETGAD